MKITILGDGKDLVSCLTLAFTKAKNTPEVAQNLKDADFSINSLVA